MTIKQLASSFSLSQWCLYQAIKLDPSNPDVNLGPAKSYHIQEIRLRDWPQKHPRQVVKKGILIPTRSAFFKRWGYEQARVTIINIRSPFKILGQKKELYNPVQAGH